MSKWNRMYEYVSDRIESTEDTIQNALTCVDDITKAAELLITCFKSGNKLLLCGNGGSAADCQHLATEFMSSGFPAIALTTDSSFLTAWSNDHTYDQVFVQQIRVLGKPGDVLLGISTSGLSDNVLNALNYASWNSINTVALSGQNGMCKEVNVDIKIPSTNTQYIPEAHLMVEHILWELVKGQDDNH